MYSLEKKKKESKCKGLNDLNKISSPCVGRLFIVQQKKIITCDALPTTLLSMGLQSNQK